MSYNKIKLEEAYRTGGILERPIKHTLKEARPTIKKDDIDLIVSIPNSNDVLHVIYMRKGS